MPSKSHNKARTWIKRITFLLNYNLGGILRMRKFVNSGAWFFRPPEKIKIEPVMVEHLPAELVIPPEVKLNGVLLYFHGGGYCIGSLGSHRGLVGKIALEAGIKTIHIDYRLAPEHPYPAAVEDAILAYEWILSKGKKPEEIVLGGDSAGGGLVISTLIELKNRNIPLPLAAFCMSPWVDLSFSGNSAVKNAFMDPIIPVPKIHYWALAYAGDLPLDHPGPSPLYADLSNLPPIFIQASESEVLTDDSLRLVQKIQEAGGEVELDTWPGMLHVWQILWRRVPESRKAIEKIAEFLTKWLSNA